MKKIRYTILLSVVIAIQVSAQAEDKSSNAETIFPKGEELISENFTKPVWVSFLVPSDSLNPTYVGNVTFPPGARTNWHSHPTGQILLVTEGVGYYQEKGNQMITLRKGDAIKSPPNVPHWHGASPNNDFVQLAISSKEGGPTQWLDPVDDTYYESLDPSDSEINEEQVLLELSKQKWLWMADKDVGKLASLFHDKSKFVHMSGTWKKDRELEIIESGSIWYKKADVHDATVEIIDETAILWNRITLQAVVRGSEVSNEFTVTEVYKKLNNEWKLFALTFSSVRDTHSIEH